jgi:Integrase core domain
MAKRSQAEAEIVPLMAEILDGDSRVTRQDRLPAPLTDPSGGLATKRPTRPTGSPWENGYIESFNARLRDELLNGEIFYTLREAQIVIESWRRHYNTIRPHERSGYWWCLGDTRINALRRALQAMVKSEKVY